MNEALRTPIESPQITAMGDLTPFPKSVHTPGPWTVERGNFGTGRFIADATKYPICTLSGNGTPEGMKREREGVAEANARLIAAAPDLYAALKAIVDLLPSDGFIGEPGPGIIAARAAILKAEGA